MPQQFDADFVIVGGGSAGCVLANRLSADPANRVLLLEAGGDDRPLRNWKQFSSGMLIQIPVGFARTMKDPRINWGYRTEPDEQTGGRQHDMPRGRVLGGCSSINAMLYVRGQHEDYDHWRQLGCTGWGWDDVLPYFRRAQNQERGESAWHGVGGPLAVTDGRERMPISEAVMDAAEAIGIPRVDDINGEQQEGITWSQVTMKRGLRHSAAGAYLHPAEKRPNLRVLTGALAHKVLIEQGEAVGVAFTLDGEPAQANAAAEVILCGGAFNSPHLLELSGIGQPERLQALGLAVIHAAPEVGENLQDHYMTAISFRLAPGELSINARTTGFPLAMEALKWAFTRRGLLALSSSQLLLFARSRPDLASPDLQMHITPATMNSKKLALGKMVADDDPGLTFAPCHLRPESRGHVHARSASPFDLPGVVPNFLTSEVDRAAQIAGIKLARRIAETGPLAARIDAELSPGTGVASDDDMLAYARRRGTTVHHPVGTCRMGGDERAVLDPELRVRGVGRLRVVDASVMPRLVSGNTNAPTMMIAEKAADMVLRDREAVRVAA